MIGSPSPWSVSGLSMRSGPAYTPAGTVIVSPGCAADSAAARSKTGAWALAAAVKSRLLRALNRVNLESNVLSVVRIIVLSFLLRIDQRLVGPAMKEETDHNQHRGGGSQPQPPFRHSHGAELCNF